MYGASDLRKGLKVEIDGQPYVITEYQFTKPGKGQAIYTCRLKNMINGSTLQKQYRANDKIDQPRLEQKALRYSYQDGESFVFLDAHYEQVSLGRESLGEQAAFLVEDMEIEVLYHNGRAIGVELPYFVEKVIAYTEPGVRGDTATNVTKTARIDNGYELQVPLFINTGDTIRIDTRTGAYAERVRTA